MLAVESSNASRAAISADLAAALAAITAAFAALAALVPQGGLFVPQGGLFAAQGGLFAAYCRRIVVVGIPHVTTGSRAGARLLGRCKAVTLPPPPGAVSCATAGAARAPGGGDTGAQHGAESGARNGARNSGDRWVRL